MSTPLRIVTLGMLVLAIVATLVTGAGSESPPPGVPIDGVPVVGVQRGPFALDPKLPLGGAAFPPNLHPADDTWSPALDPKESFPLWLSAPPSTMKPVPPTDADGDPKVPR